MEGGYSEWRVEEEPMWRMRQQQNISGKSSSNINVVITYGIGSPGIYSGYGSVESRSNESEVFHLPCLNDNYSFHWKHENQIPVNSE